MCHIREKSVTSLIVSGPSPSNPFVVTFDVSPKTLLQMLSKVFGSNCFIPLVLSHHCHLSDISS